MTVAAAFVAGDMGVARARADTAAASTTDAVAMPSTAIDSLPLRSPRAEAEMPAAGRRADRGQRLLHAAALFCLGVLGAGQLLFAAYIVGFYARSAWLGRLDDWNKVLPHGHVPGDTAGNVLLGLHLAFAVLIIVGGLLQLLPALRRSRPRLHRWNGRVYLIAALTLSAGGVVMLWTRGGVGDLSQHLALTLNAVLIAGFAAIALHHARARRFEAHRRWALRLFLAVGGVWFFRVGLSLWILANGGAIGFDPKTFSGPALTVIAFGQYLVPLALLELYLRAQCAAAAAPRIAMAATLATLSLLLGAAIAAAALMLWLPRL